ncbi:Ragulator complex subunit, LAMTOR4-like protein [Schizosaccharomyces osmophilus]|uniref:Ragulator complex subunit, LAMTOR4-like protein n=1 Tax=Schizosaccharomyces osmophilus TaxID=2545709 RepID=A0AAE9WCN9_9SCHI|nr:Ragulator complex subunit, LAMTOR4-like protein [Schizosaccharomyces osmophilus]WBW73916.1 Ragulator complex subunit, LAMTOR4-like protein [Schizosaccharomyces osmophilus]
MEGNLVQELNKCVNEKFSGAVLTRNGLAVAVAGTISPEEERLVCEWTNSVPSEVLYIPKTNKRILVHEKESYVLGLAYRNP